MNIIAWYERVICLVNYNAIHFEKLWFLLHVLIHPDCLVDRRTVFHFIKAKQHSRRLNNEANAILNALK